MPQMYHIEEQVPIRRVGEPAAAPGVGVIGAFASAEGHPPFAPVHISFTELSKAQLSHEALTTPAGHRMRACDPVATLTIPVAGHIAVITMGKSKMVTCEATLTQSVNLDSGAAELLSVSVVASGDEGVPGVEFTITVDTDNADLNGLYIDVGNDGGDITSIDTSTGAGGNNMNGACSNTGETLDGFDYAVELGSVGGGDEPVTAITVTVDDIAIEDVEGAQIGIRATSVGADASGSVKLCGIAECDDDGNGDQTFEVDRGISNIVLYLDCDDDGLSDTKIIFDEFDDLDCNDNGVPGEDDDEIFLVSLAQLEAARDAVGFADCDIVGLTIKAGPNGGGFGPGEGEFFAVADDAEGNSDGFAAEFFATGTAEIWC